MTAISRVRNNDESIWIIGIDDPHYYGCDDLPQAVKGVPDGSFKILLVHTPEMLREAHQAGISLYLCGHTHAGQICLPWIGPLVINADCRRSFVSGTWRYGEMCGYTNPGCGTSLLPVRFLCPPEITLITLHR